MLDIENYSYIICAGTVKAQYHSDNKKPDQAQRPQSSDLITKEVAEVEEEDRKEDECAKSQEGIELRDIPEQVQQLTT